MTGRAGAPPGPGPSDDPAVALALRRSSWLWIFHVLLELGLGRMSASRAALYYQDHGAHFTTGGFWASIQALQQQLDDIDRKERENA